MNVWHLILHGKAFLIFNTCVFLNFEKIFKLFQTCMSFFLLLNTKEDILKNEKKTSSYVFSRRKNLIGGELYDDKMLILWSWSRQSPKLQTECQNGKEMWFMQFWAWHGCWCQTGQSEYFTICSVTGISTHNHF